MYWMEKQDGSGKETGVDKGKEVLLGSDSVLYRCEQPRSGWRQDRE